MNAEQLPLPSQGPPLSSQGPPLPSSEPPLLPQGPPLPPQEPYPGHPPPPPEADSRPPEPLPDDPPSDIDGEPLESEEISTHHGVNRPSSDEQASSTKCGSSPVKSSPIQHGLSSISPKAISISVGEKRKAEDLRPSTFNTTPIVRKVKSFKPLKKSGTKPGFAIKVASKVSFCVFIQYISVCLTLFY